MSDTPDEKLARIERGLNALFAAEVVEDILEAVDFEALLSDEPVDDPVDVERLASALGRPLGRVLAARVVDNGGLAGALTKTVGSEFGSRVASRALRVAAENLDADDGATNLAALEDALPGSTAEGLTDAEIAAPSDGEVVGGATGAGSAADDGGWTEIGVSGPDDDGASNPQDGSTDGHDAADGQDATDGHDDATDARADSSADEDEEKN